MKMKMKNRSHRYGIDDDDAYMHSATPKQHLRLNS